MGSHGSDAERLLIGLDDVPGNGCAVRVREAEILGVDGGTPAALEGDEIDREALAEGEGCAKAAEIMESSLGQVRVTGRDEVMPELGEGGRVEKGLPVWAAE